MLGLDLVASQLGLRTPAGAGAPSSSGRSHDQSDQLPLRRTAEHRSRDRPSTQRDPSNDVVMSGDTVWRAAGRWFSNLYVRAATTNSFRGRVRKIDCLRAWARTSRVFDQVCLACVQVSKSRPSPLVVEASALDACLTNALAIRITIRESIGFLDAAGKERNTLACSTTHVHHAGWRTIEWGSVREIVLSDSANMPAAPAVHWVDLGIGAAHACGTARSTRARRTSSPSASAAGARRAASTCHGAQTAVSARSAGRVGTGAALRIAARRSTRASALRPARPPHVPHTHVGQAGEPREARAVEASAALRSALALSGAAVATVTARAGDRPQRRGPIDHRARPSPAGDFPHGAKGFHARSGYARPGVAAYHHLVGVLS
jgi:hypothetical protein